MKAIACADLGWGIGKGGDLIYNIPEDMKFFRAMTGGKTVIMGRATLESLPGGKPLPKRRNIIISKTLESVEGAEVCKSPEEAAELLKDELSENIFVIGGEQIYREMLPYCDAVYITRVEAESNADRRFPNLDADVEWKIAEKSPRYEHEGLFYSFATYKRV